MNALIPWEPGPSVRANTMNRLAYPPAEIHILRPLITYEPSASRRPCVFKPATSDPASGSVNAYEPNRSPDAIRGSQVRFCSSVP